MTFKTIATNRLIIRGLHLDDAIAISHYRSLPEVSRYQSWDHYTIQKATDLVNEMQTTSPEVKEKWFQFGIELVSEKKLIGDIGFLNTDATDGTSWIGFTLDSAYWGKGYAREAVSTVLDFYKTLGIFDVRASTDPLNDSSKNLLEKIGFILIDSQPDDLTFRKN